LEQCKKGGRNFSKQHGGLSFSRSGTKVFKVRMGQSLRKRRDAIKRGRVGGKKKVRKS